MPPLVFLSFLNVCMDGNETGCHRCLTRSWCPCYLNDSSPYYNHDPPAPSPGRPSYSNYVSHFIASRTFSPRTHVLKVTIFLSVSPALAFFTPSTTLSTLRCTSSSSSRTTMAAGKDATLYDFPVSNNGGRCRVVIYDKGIQDKVNTEMTIIAPTPLPLPSSLPAFLKTDRDQQTRRCLVNNHRQLLTFSSLIFSFFPSFLSFSDQIEIKKPDGALSEINPQGKVPVLIDHSLNEFQIFESDTILRHLVGKYEGTGPSYLPSSLAARTKSDLICRFHDMYITTIQGCMYKAIPPFGIFDNREDALVELKKQMKLLEGMVDGEGPFLCGKEKSMADATLFCTGVFLEQILPNHFGWTYQEVFGPLLTKWWENLLATEPAFQKVGASPLFLFSFIPSLPPARPLFLESSKSFFSSHQDKSINTHKKHPIGAFRNHPGHPRLGGEAAVDDHPRGGLPGSGPSHGF